MAPLPAGLRLCKKFSTPWQILRPAAHFSTMGSGLFPGFANRSRRVSVFCDADATGLKVASGAQVAREANQIYDSESGISFSLAIECGLSGF
jgi:hypothetical protein